MGQIAVAQAVAKLLEKMGTEVFFGVNGHGNWALLDALVHETGIRGCRRGPRTTPCRWRTGIGVCGVLRR